MLAFAPEELNRRRVAWELISRLFLDTDYTPKELQQLGLDLVRTGYTLPELEAIALDEVFPVCSPNLLNFIGEWHSFSEEWLESSILNLPTTRPWPIQRWWRRHCFNRYCGDWWRAIGAEFAKSRAPSGDAAAQHPISRP